jgi:gliding motility-associated protein GldM
MKKPGTNEYIMYPFEHTFIAAKPSTVVSPTAMNILYKAVENPVSVSVGGYAAENISISVTGGKSSGSKGNYMIMPSSSARECVVNVSVKDKEGRTTNMGKQVFRVKRLPDPNVKFATIVGSGKASKGQIGASKSVKVDQKDMLFDGIKYKVTAFDVVFPSSKGSVVLSSKSDKVTSQMKAKFGNLRKGQTVIVKNVKLQLNSDKPRPVMSNIIIEVK